MSDPIAVVLGQLQGGKRQGAGYVAKCPAHEDRTPSLSVTAADDGRVLLHCHAGCSVEAIARAIGLELRDLFPAPNETGEIWTPAGPAVAVYQYVDEKGVVLFEVTRTADKKFSQRVPDPSASRGYRWKLGKVRRVLFHLPQLRAAVAAGETVYIAEGEKDVLALEKAGVTATCNSAGAGKWRSVYNAELRGANVVIIADKDEPGRNHATKVACALRGIVRSCRIVEAAVGKDAADHLNAGRTVAEFVSVQNASEKPKAAPDEGQGHPTQAELLLGLAADAELFHTPEGREYATVAIGGHRETWMLGQHGFRLWLTRKFFDLEGKPASPQAMDSVLDVLRARARFDGAEEPVFVRAGQGDDGALYLDRGSAEWDAMKITATGWEVISEAPIRFRRPKGMCSLPLPERGGSLELLRPLVNLQEDDQWTLTLAWLIAALWPHGPYPILVVEGEQGSAKSVLVRIIRSLLDPCTAPLRSAPRDERDLMIAATNSLIVSYDNFSSVRDWLSDALCRLSTGGGMSTRGLYTDDEEFIFDAQRPVVVTGIANLCERDDLRDRAVILTLREISETARRNEADLWAAFLDVRPRVLGALLDALSIAISRFDSIRLERSPRMADFARLATAAEPGLGFGDGGFMRAYDTSRAEAVETSIELHPVAKAVRDFATADQWQGTTTEFLVLLTNRVSEQISKSKEWPKTATRLSTELTRVAPALRKVGVTIEHVRSGDRKRTRLLQVRRVPGADADPDAGGHAADGATPELRPPGKAVGGGNLGGRADAPDASAPLFAVLSDEDLEERLAIQDEGQPGLIGAGRMSSRRP